MWFVKVGSRVTGPFNEEEMRAKRLCKELAPFHLVSRDGVRWESAAPLIKLLDGAQPEWKRPTLAEPIVEKRRDNRDELDPASASQWYYVDPTRKQLGPISQAAIGELLRSKQLPGKTLVCKEGETQWNQAKLHPELGLYVPKGPSRNVLIAASAGLGVVTLSVILGFFLFNRSNPSPFGASLAGVSSKAGTIRSIKDEARLQKAIGFVVCGWNVALKNGNVFDELDGSGTCFSVSNDGLLMTNKHVVEDAEKRQRMSDDFVFNDFVYQNVVKPKARQLYAELIQTGKIPKPTTDEEIDKGVDDCATALIKQGTLVQKYRDIVKEIKPRVWVFLGSRDDLYVAKILYVSEQHDMAVLKINATDLPCLKMASQEELPTRGTDVFALGFPGTSRIAASTEELTLDRTKKSQTIKAEYRDSDFFYVETKGVVTKVFRENAGGRQWIQHDAEINPGNSGGPLVTADCKVVAINTQAHRKERDNTATLRSLAVPQLLGEVSPYIKHTAVEE